MTTKEQLNKRAEEKEFDAKMIKAYAEIVELLEQRRTNWYSMSDSLFISEDDDKGLPFERAMDGCEAEYQAYTKVIEAILKLAK